MKTVEIDDELYQYIASQTLHIGESASSILRRLHSIQPKGVVTVRADSNHQYIDTSSLVALVNSDDFLAEKKLVNRFIAILATLYSCDKGLFSIAATSLHGSKRRYLAKDEATLLKSGNNTKPKQIPNTPYRVVTNSNTARKIFIMESLMRDMAIPDEIISLVETQFIAKPFI